MSKRKKRVYCRNCVYRGLYWCSSDNDYCKHSNNTKIEYRDTYLKRLTNYSYTLKMSDLNEFNECPYYLSNTFLEWFFSLNGWKYILGIDKVS